MALIGNAKIQAGILAGAGIYALENNIERLKIDNNRAKEVAEVLSTQSYVKEIKPVQTNILIFDLADTFSSTTFLAKLEDHGILAPPFGKNTIRFTFHMGITEEDMFNIKKILCEL